MGIDNIEQNNRITGYLESDFVYTDSVQEYCDKFYDQIKVAEQVLNKEYNIVLPHFDKKYKHVNMDNHYGISYNKLIDDLSRGVAEIIDANFNVIKHSRTQSISFRENDGYNYVTLRFPDKFKSPVQFVFKPDDDEDSSPEFDVNEFYDSDNFTLEEIEDVDKLSEVDQDAV